MQVIRKCPVCGNAMTQELKYVYRVPRLQCRCPICGYKTKDEQITVSDHTQWTNEPTISNSTGGNQHE